jgi:hypothetical protein
MHNLVQASNHAQKKPKRIELSKPVDTKQNSIRQTTWSSGRNLAELEYAEQI